MTGSASGRAILTPKNQTVKTGGLVKGGPGEADDSPRVPRDQWFLGAYWRQLWVPSVLQGLFFDLAPSVSSGLFGLDPNIGAVATWRAADGFSIQFGLGYESYAFEGFFRIKGDPPENTEFVRSDLGVVHATASILWSTRIHEMLALEYGVGVDLGLVLGDIERSEAYYEDGGWHACERAGEPDNEIYPGQLFCEYPIAEDAPTDQADELGAHYDVKTGKISDGGYIPDAILIPAVPHLALRFSPIQHLAFKLEAAYGIAMFWVGISAHGAFWTGPKPAPPPDEVQVLERVVEVPVPVPVPPPTMGRVIGTVEEEAAGTPVAGALVRFTERKLSPVLTSEDGSFRGYRCEPGEVFLQVSHPEYEPGDCSAVIPQEGGDVQARCVLVAKPRVGAIDGRVIDNSGNEVTGVEIQLSGPLTRTLVSDATGAFKLDQAPPGSYEARVDAEGYLIRLQQFAVVARETASPQITLYAKPEKLLVKVRKNEIVLRRRINFATNSAEVTADNDSLMMQIADVLLRQPEIVRVEIQGHTDNRGSNSYNLELSQKRAEAVRNWLVQAGVTPIRLEAVGYGETRPVLPNITRMNRARNRRVQFMIRERSQVP